MSRRARFFAASALALATCIGAVTVAEASGGAGGGPSLSKAGFSPAVIEGKWLGDWRNTTFNTTGTIRANVKERAGGKLFLLVDFGGPVFGCNDPAPVSVTLPRIQPAPSLPPRHPPLSQRRNGWLPGGFIVTKKTQAFGNVKVIYDFASKSFKGSGSAPPCDPSIVYTIRGKLTPTKFKAKVSINLGSQTATSILTARKQ